MTYNTFKCLDIEYKIHCMDKIQPENWAFWHLNTLLGRTYDLFLANINTTSLT